MMKKHIGLLLVFVLFGCSTVVFAQRRPCVTPVPKLNATITHATCFNSSGDISFTISAPNGSYVGSLKLFNEANIAVYTHNSTSLSGTITDLAVGRYEFTGSVIVQYQCDGKTYITSVPVSWYVWVGIETVWVEKIDMIAFPNSYSAKRNASTATYGGVRSSNGMDSGDGWIEMSAVYGNTTNSRVYWLIGETNPLGTFSPNSQIQYIEFFKSSGGNGIRIKYQSGGSYLYATLSTNPNDKIRLVRNGSTLTIQKNNSSSTIFTLPTSYTGPMNIAVRSFAENDGCKDVVSSFSCKSEQYAKVERKLRGVKYQVPGDFLKFYVTEEYDNQSPDLLYNVYSSLDRVNPILSGSQQVKSVEYGDNRYHLDVSSLSSGAYILEVINEKKEKFYLRFLKQ